MPKNYYQSDFKMNEVLMVLVIEFRALTLLNKMGPLSASTVTLLKQDELFSMSLGSLLTFGMLHSRPQCMSSIAYLQSPSNGVSPWECLFHTQPDYRFLRTFMSLCFPLLRPYNKHKLEPRSLPCVFIG